MARFLSILAVCLCASILWFCGSRFVLPAPQDAGWIEDLYRVKTAAVERTDGPAIFIVAGSSGLYGYSADVLSVRLGRPVVNFATHAGLGAEYLLYRAEKVAKPGDTIVIAIEPSLIGADYTSVVLARYVQFFDTSYLLSISPTRWAPYVFGTTLHDLLRSWGAEHIIGPTPANVDALGDKLDNLQASVTPEMKAVVGALQPAVSGVNPDAPPQYLLNFLTWAAINDVSVLYGWSPMLDSPSFHDAADPSRLDILAATYEKLGVPALGTPQEFLYPLEDMFDSSFHLNDVGRRKATATMGDLLCARMGC